MNSNGEYEGTKNITIEDFSSLEKLNDENNDPNFEKELSMLSDKKDRSKY